MYQVTDRMWDFGDGATSTDRAPFHSFAEPGRYRVTLTVSSGNGTDTVAKVVDLRGPPLRDDPPPVSTVD
jgi:PKD repeat protein